MATRLLVVDDHPLTRLGVADIVAGYDDIEMIGDTVTATARSAIKSWQPDVVIVGVHGPIGAAARLLQPRLGVVVLDEDEDPSRMIAALDHGFSTYVALSDPADEIISAVRHAHVYPTAFCAAGLAEAVRTTTARDGLLSSRERQVLMLLREGYSGAEIAAQLGVSDSSVKTYVTRIYAKLEVSNRSQALVAALGRGLLPLPVPEPV
jgi:DNA-binding NarL/FixJ family response regulator